MNFLNALEKIPGYTEQEQKRIADLQKDLPMLKEVVNGVWTKERKLHELKTELAAVDRKIQLSIKPQGDTVNAEDTGKKESVSSKSDTIVRVKGIHLPKGML